MIQNLNKRLENTTCFSQSSLWHHIQQFYLTQGLKAWDQQIPYLVTNSRISAHHHAHTILQHAKGPYSIIDYGAATGQHAYYLAKYLIELAPLYQKPLAWFSIYLAEISSKTRESWKTNPYLSPLIQSNLIIPLPLSGNWLTDIAKLPNTPQHCLIANYLLDSMPFIAYDNHLLMGLSLYAKRKHCPNPSLDQIILKTQSLPSSHHSHPKLKERYGSKRYTIPTTAIAFIEAFFQRSQDAIMIINDKMFSTLDQIDYDPLYNLTLEGCYSTTLNMDAILHHTGLNHQIINHCPRLQTAILSHHPITPKHILTCSDTASLFDFFKQQDTILGKHCFSIAATLHFDPFAIELISQSISPDDTSQATLCSLITQCQSHLFSNSHRFFHLHAAKIFRKCHYYSLAEQSLNQYLNQHGTHPAYHLEAGILYHAWGKIDQALTHLKLAALDKHTKFSAETLLNTLA